jgi:hypothetical protein
MHASDLFTYCHWQAICTTVIPVGNTLSVTKKDNFHSGSEVAKMLKTIQKKKRCRCIHLMPSEFDSVVFVSYRRTPVIT